MSMLDVIIVGAGAAGLSAALAVHEQGFSYLVLEQHRLANTVANMPRRKRIFSTPTKLPQRGRFWFGDTTREELLAQWHDLVRQQGLDVREQDGVSDITPVGDHFRVHTAMRVHPQV